MILLGALVNALEAASGGVIGVLLKRHVSQDLGDFLLKGQGLCCLLVGVQGMVSGGSVVVVSLCMALGCWAGYALGIDRRVRKLGDAVQVRLDATLASSQALGSFSEGFVASTIFCCTGAMAIVGALSSGVSLDHSTLIAKGVIDLVVCISMGASLGIGVPFGGISIFVYEGVLTLIAAALGSLLPDAVIAEMAATGSLLLLAMGFNLLGITRLRVADMLPSAFMPIVVVPVLKLLQLI